MSGFTMNRDSDAGLLRAALAGDESAFAALYDKYQAGLYRFACQMSGSSQVAEEVTQDVFLTLLREGSKYDGRRGALSTFLYGIARNLVLRALERDRSQAFVERTEGEIERSGELAGDADLMRDLLQAQTVAAVRQAILSLPPQYREVTVLCDLQELSYAEAAQALGCAVGTVRSRLHRARALLLDKLRLLNQDHVPVRGTVHRAELAL
jgi:RNA polymerase sigma-70 factor, ECF subfamily